MSVPQDPKMEPEPKRPKIVRWQPEELAKMNDIVHDLEDSSKGGKIDRQAFWQEVTELMKQNGFDRKLTAIYTKYQRINKKSMPKSLSKNPSSIWDMSDGDLFRNEEDDSDDEDGEGVGGETLPEKKFRDHGFQSWTEGNNWSEEEDAIAFECIRSQRDRERELKVEPITADQLWHMVSDSLASHGFYRKYTNVCRYWSTKGREKHNLDARTPSTIEKASGETNRLPRMQSQQTPSKPAVRPDNPSRSIPGSSTKESFQQDNSNTESVLGDAQLPDLTLQQHAKLQAEYAKYNNLHNPVVIELEKETGLNREQIKIWYRRQRAMDAKEADLQAGKEPSNPLDNSELEGIGLKRHRASDIGIQSQVEERPGKISRPSPSSEGLIDNHKGVPVLLKVHNEASDNNPTISGRGAPSNNDPAPSTPKAYQPSPKPVASTPKAHQPSPQSVAQRASPYQPDQLKEVLTAERNMVQQKMLAAEEEHRQLKLAILAHNQKAEAELTAAKAKEQELTVQEEIHKKSKDRIKKIELLLDD